MYIVIPAYKAEKWIEECLDAACSQASVLLGIDGCEATFNKVKEIRHKYSNLQVFYYPENKGTYVTLNTLIRHAGDVFLVFGADDVMSDGMVEKMKSNAPCISKHNGIICLTKQMYDEFGGYRPWRIEADTDLLERIKTKYKVKVLPKMFFRREHKGQLTKGKKTGLKTPYRRSLRKITKSEIKKGNTYVKSVYHNHSIQG